MTKIPVEQILAQLLNFSILILILFFALRKKIVQLFLDRRQSYEKAVTTAQSARQQAEVHHLQIKEQLEKLNATAGESLQQAQSEAAELRAQILAEASSLSERLRVDAKRTAQTELERAKNELREELLTRALASAHEILNEKLKESDQKRLQSEFVEKIQVVRP